MNLFPAARKVENLLYLSGQIPVAGERTESSDATTQARAVFASVQKVLRENGLTLKYVEYVTCYLQNPSDFDSYNAVWQEVFPDSPPARTTVSAAILADNALVEVSVTASFPPER